MLKYLLSVLIIIHANLATAQDFKWLSKPTLCAPSDTLLGYLKEGYEPIGRSWITSEEGQVIGIVWLAVTKEGELVVVEQFETIACIVSVSKGLQLIKKPANSI